MKISFLKTRYQVDDNVTKCILYIAIRNNNIQYNEHHTIIGKAVCSKDDKFDFEIGKRIALAKAEQKAYKMAYRLVKETLNIAGKYIDDLREFESFAARQIEHNRQYLSEERYLNYKKN